MLFLPLRVSLGGLVLLLASNASAQTSRNTKAARPTAPAAKPAQNPQPTPSPAGATSSVASSDENPWSKGVSNENKTQARALLAAGNEEFVQDRHTAALEKYQAALVVWDHPAIAFNTVRALVRLERNVEASDMLQRAMRFAAAPLGDEVFAEAQNYQRLLASLVAKVEVRCAQPATLSLDGESVTCPGTRGFRLKPGRHTIAGSQPGFVAITRLETLVAGDNPVIDVKLMTIESATFTKTRWATWKPWAVTGVGLAVTGLGVLLEFDALSIRSEYSAAVRDQCTKACLPSDLDATAQALDDRWRRREVVAISTLAVGGAVLATGVTMLILNRPKPYIKEQPRSIAWGVDFVGHGIVASGRF